LLGDFGDPRATTSFHLCLFDSTGSNWELVLDLPLPVGPPWRLIREQSYTLVDATAGEHGVRRVKLKTGTANRARIEFKAAGAKLPQTTAASALRLMNQEPAVRVELVNDQDECWISDFTQPDTNRNQGRRFKAVVR
jgi:hypothetical protein